MPCYRGSNSLLFPTLKLWLWNEIEYTPSNRLLCHPFPLEISCVQDADEKATIRKLLYRKHPAITLPYCLFLQSPRGKHIVNIRLLERLLLRTNLCIFCVLRQGWISVYLPWLNFIAWLSERLKMAGVWGVFASRRASSVCSSLSDPSWYIASVCRDARLKDCC